MSSEAAPLARPEPQYNELLKEINRDTLLTMLELVDPLCIATRVPTSQRHGNAKYGVMIHAKLLQQKALGFGDAACARGVGIQPQTLQHWYELYPGLETDMLQVEQLCKTHAARLLFLKMNEDGPTGLNAVKFFLASRTEEFREKSEVEVKTVDRHEVSIAIQNLYGLALPDRSALPAPQGEPDADPDS